MKNNKNNNNQNQSTQIVATVLAIAILIIAVVGISFAAFTYSKAGQKTNTITTGSITMNYVEGDKYIDIVDAFPVSDAVGKAFTEDSLGEDTNAGTINSGNESAAGVFDFNVSANISSSASINYDVMAVKQSDSTLPEEAVKVYLEKSEAATYASTTVAKDVTKFSALGAASTATTDEAKALEGGEKVLASSTFSGPGETTHYYRFRMWVSDDYGSSDATGKTFEESKTFKVKIDVYGQAGTGA